jgi:hypothetical protein
LSFVSTTCSFFFEQQIIEKKTTNENECAMKLFIFFSLIIFSYADRQRFGAWPKSAFRNTKLSASTELDTKHKASFNY